MSTDVLRLSPWYNDFLPISASKTACLDMNAIIIPSQLCSKCGLVSVWLQENWNLIQIPDQEFEHSICHYKSAHELEKSHLGGCHLCTLFWHAFDCKIVSSPEYRRKKRETNFQKLLNIQEMAVRIYNKGTSGPVLLLTAKIAGGGLVNTESIPLRKESFNASLMDSPARSLASTVPHNITLSTKSNACREIIQQWTTRCDKSHRKCWEGKTTTLPKRLVDVEHADDTGHIRVMETNHLSTEVRFAALSYCWGNTSTLRLTLSTMKEFTTGVAIERLPSTLQDAIDITRSIGLRWLWIDSLCIIQDSKDDWKKEAAIMGDVYRNAFVTIAALGASHNDEGLFAVRDPLIYIPCRLFQAASGEIIYADQDRTLCPGLGTWPLYTRGWVMQERLLSPRTLKFGPYLSWECREETLDEFNRGFCGDAEAGSELIEQFFSFVTNKRPHRLLALETYNVILNLWEQIVALYSEASFTVQTDRLTAISGIANAIQMRTGWKYLAGIWEPFLWKQLLWQLSFGSQSVPSGLSPSWSWVASTGGIIWPNDEPEEGHFLNPLCSIETHSYTPVETKENKGNTDTRLALKISCLAMKIGRLFPLAQMKSRFGVEFIDSPVAGKAFYDPDYILAMENPNLFLPIAAGDWDGSGVEFIGLAVSPSHSYPGAFQRVGYMTLRLDEHLESLSHVIWDFFYNVNARRDILLV